MPAEGARVPKVSQAHVQSRREQILRAAHECFARKGFQRTTMREICRRAELSPGAVYLYFRSKEQIVGALARHYGDQRRTVLEPPGDDRDTGTALFAFLGKLAELNPGPGAAEMDLRLWAESLDTPVLRRLVHGAFAELTETLTALFRRGQERGDVSADVDAKGLAWAIVALLTGFGLLSLFEDAFEPEAYYETVGRMLGRALGGDGAKGGE